MRFSAVFAVLVGLGMVGQWLVSYFAGGIAELKTEPVRIGFHLAAEMATATCLVAAGVGLWIGQAWAEVLYFIASGMLFYTAVVSPGYFAQKGQWGWLGIFAGILVLGLIGVVLVSR